MTKERALAIGLDIGHSAVKVAYSSRTGEGKPETIIFPSVVMPSVVISDDAEARRAAADTVVVDGQSFFFGETASVQGGRTIENIVAEDWITSKEHAALLAGALKKLKERGVFEPASMIVMGLPTSLYSRQRDDLRRIVSEMVGPGKEVKIIPQPLGAYQYNMLDENGCQAANRSFSNESWGVVEVGYFSTDFMAMKGTGNQSRWFQGASGICSGIRVAAERLVRLIAEEVEVGGKKGVTVGLREAEAALQTGYIKYFGKVDVTAQVEKAADVIAQEVIRAATRYMENEAAGLDGIVLAGGGAPLVKASLASKWPHVIMTPNPRFSVVEGFRRFGVGVLNARASS
jgi:plasmid segregation protein ParM